MTPAPTQLYLGGQPVRGFALGAETVTPEAGSTWRFQFRYTPESMPCESLKQGYTSGMQAAGHYVLAFDCPIPGVAQAKVTFGPNVAPISIGNSVAMGSVSVTLEGAEKVGSRTASETLTQPPEKKLSTGAVVGLSLAGAAVIGGGIYLARRAA